MLELITDTLKALIRELKEDRKFLVALVLLSFLWMGVAPTFYAIVTEGPIMLWLDRIYNLFDNNLLLNIPVCTCLIYLQIKWSKRVWPDEPKLFIPLLLIVFAHLLFYYQSPFEYAKIAWIVDYRSFLLSLIISSAYLQWNKFLFRIGSILYILSLSLFLFIYYQWSSNLTNEEWFRNHLTYLLLISFILIYILYSFVPFRKQYWGELFSWGFTPDYYTKIEQPEFLVSYAQSIVDRLLHTDLTCGSFAVGITSEWGAGKTTFLRLLKDTIGNQAEVVEFNPWMCRTPEQLINDFFSSLSHQLSKQYSSLAHPIKNYARYLNNISIPASPLFSVKMSNFFYEGSLFERKKKLSEKLLKIDKRVIVIIDDIDRLEREEVFEVLRLIRNTADLCNVIYLVAYDKEYVTSVLNEKNNVRDASIYMEKIFQIEIQLPKVSEESIWNTFINELRSQLHDSKIMLHFSDDDKHLILSLLNTYRRAKRFARLFSLNYSYLKRRTCILEWTEVFWIDMLQMHNKAIYNILCNDREKLLDVNGNQYYYNPSVERYRVDDKTKAILIRLWGKEHTDYNYYSIRYMESFNKYFTLQYQLSDEELDKLLTNNDFDNLAKISEENGLDFNNLWKNVKRKLETKSLNEQQKKSILIILLNMCYNGHEYSIGSMLSYIKELLTDIQDSEFFTLVDSWQNTKLSETGNRIILSAIMGEIAGANLLKRDAVQELIRSIIQDYLDKEVLPVSDLLNYDSNINMIIRYLYLRNRESNYSGKERRQDAFIYLMTALFGKEKMTMTEEELNQKAIPTFKDIYEDNWKNNLWSFVETCCEKAIPLPMIQ